MSLKNEPDNRSITVSPDTLSDVAAKFREAGEETDRIINQLRDTLKDLENTWKGADQQMFYKYFDEWQSHMTGVSHLIRLAAQDLDSMSERYFAADRDRIIKE